MNNKVLVVAHKETGDVVTVREITDSRTGETREVGTVMVQSKALANFGGGITRVATRTAFITLEMDAIEFLGAELQAGKAFPQPGKIVVLETLVPYTKKDGTVQEPKMNPSTNEVLTHNGQPIYRNVEFVADVNMQDVLISHDKDDEELVGEDNLDLGLEVDAPKGKQGKE